MKAAEQQYCKIKVTFICLGKTGDMILKGDKGLHFASTVKGKYTLDIKN